jgi:hypothetical protein
MCMKKILVSIYAVKMSFHVGDRVDIANRKDFRDRILLKNIRVTVNTFILRLCEGFTCDKKLTSFSDLV